MRIFIVSKSYHYENGAVSKQLTDVGRDGVIANLLRGAGMD